MGGESGPGARPIKKEWVKDIHKACERNNVPFFFRQWGKKSFNVNPNDLTMAKDHPEYAKGGCQLEGIVYRQMPERTLFSFS